METSGNSDGAEITKILTQNQFNLFKNIGYIVLISFVDKPLQLFYTAKVANKYINEWTTRLASGVNCP